MNEKPLTASERETILAAAQGDDDALIEAGIGEVCKWLERFEATVRDLESTQRPVFVRTSHLLDVMLHGVTDLEESDVHHAIVNSCILETGGEPVTLRFNTPLSFRCYEMVFQAIPQKHLNAATHLSALVIEALPPKLWNACVAAIEGDEKAGREIALQTLREWIAGKLSEHE